MSAHVFVDTNVLLDVLACRKEFYAESAAIWILAEQGRIRAHISVISFTNIFYIVRKARDRKAAVHAITKMRDVFVPVSLDGQILNQAVDAHFDDFEDAVQYFSALRSGVSCLVTRDPGHFPKSGSLTVASPAAFLAGISMRPSQ